MARPKPVPPVLLVLDVSARKNFSKIIANYCYEGKNIEINVFKNGENAVVTFINQGDKIEKEIPLPFALEAEKGQYDYFQAERTED